MRNISICHVSCSNFRFHFQSSSTSWSPGDKRERVQQECREEKRWELIVAMKTRTTAENSCALGSKADPTAPSCPDGQAGLKDLIPEHSTAWAPPSNYFKHWRLQTLAPWTNTSPWTAMCFVFLCPGPCLSQRCWVLTSMESHLHTSHKHVPSFQAGREILQERESSGKLLACKHSTHATSSTVTSHTVKILLAWKYYSSLLALTLQLF